MGRVRAAAARAEPVDRQRDRRRPGGSRRSPRRARRAWIGAPSSSPAPRERRRRGLARVHPRPAAQQLGLEARAVDLLGHGGDHALERRRRSCARRSAMTSPAAGTTLNASPERMIVGTDVSASSPPGRGVAAIACAAVASASSALTPLSGADAGVRLAAVRAHAQRPGRLALDDRPPPPPPARAGPPRSTGRRRSRRSARAWRERDHPPLLVVDEQQRDLGERRRARRPRPARAGRRRRARRRPSCRPSPTRRAARPRASAAGGRACGTTVSRWPSEQHPPLSVAAHARDEVVGVAGRRARQRARPPPPAAASSGRRRSPPRRRRGRPTARRRRPAARAGSGAAAAMQLGLLADPRVHARVLLAARRRGPCRGSR